MEHHFNNLTAVGINYHKTAVEIRSRFAFTADQISSIYQSSQNNGMSFCILSTCNRTEIYSTNASAEELASILAQHSQMEPKQLHEHIFIKKGPEVMDHIFRVTGGLDSQITGDYEVSGQMKSAFALAKQHNVADGYLEKLVTMALHISKRVKNETRLSDGATSASYVLVQMLKKLKVNDPSKRICLVGLGKIGMDTLKNLHDYLPEARITLINRSENKAKAASEEYGSDFAPFEDLEKTLKQTDVVIIATAAENPILLSEHIQNSPVKIVFDLSVPNNAEQAIRNIEGVQLYNIDQLSSIVTSTINSRKKEIPKAEAIIQEQFTELIEWHERRLKYKSIL